MHYRASVRLSQSVSITLSFSPISFGNDFIVTHIIYISIYTGESLSLPTTMRQTNVVVIPNCSELNVSFHTFDTLVMAINQARRAARDFVLKKKEETTATTKEDDWV